MSTVHTMDLSEPTTPEGRNAVDHMSSFLPRLREEAGENDRVSVFPTALFEEFAEKGLMGATVPKELGGLDVSRLYDVAVLLRTVAEADASTALALHVQLSRGLTLAYEWSHGDQTARERAEGMLRAMASGDAAVCGAVKDAPGQAVVLSPHTRGWSLSGRKILVSMAPAATHFFVHAQRRVEGEPLGLSVAVVSRDTPGLSVDPGWEGLGMRASGTVGVTFDECPVPTDAVIDRGEAGARDDGSLAGQTVSSISMLGIYAGVAQAARDTAVSTRIARAETKEPSAAERTLIAEVDARLFALRNAAGAALVNADAVGAEQGDPAERGRRMMTPFQCAKMTVNQLASDIVADCLTVVGGASYSASHTLARLYRDVRAGWFMQPYTFSDGVDYLSGQALGIQQDNDYTSFRAVRSQGTSQEG